jgi:hypothetical protein
MNHGGVGARSLNIELRAALNPAGERKVERFGWTFAPDDKVMQIENDYDKEVYNGDIGYVGDVDPETAELTVSFDGRAVTYGFGKLDVLVPAYAATIHKSQGSEYPAVIIPVLTQHYSSTTYWALSARRPASRTLRESHSLLGSRSRHLLATLATASRRARSTSTTDAKRRSGNGGFTSSAEPTNAKSPSLVRSKFGCFCC